MYRGSWSWLKRKHGIRLPISKVLHFFFSFFSSFPFLFFSLLGRALLFQPQHSSHSSSSSSSSSTRSRSLRSAFKTSSSSKTSEPLRYQETFKTYSHHKSSNDRPTLSPPIDFQFEMLKLSSNIFNSLI